MPKMEKRCFLTQAHPDAAELGVTATEIKLDMYVKKLGKHFGISELVSAMWDEWPQEKIDATLRKFRCAHCKKIPAKPLRCGGCKLVKYCNKECQTKDWKRHRGAACVSKEQRKALNKANKEKAKAVVRAQFAAANERFKDKGIVFFWPDETSEYFRCGGVEKYRESVGGKESLFCQFEKLAKYVNMVGMRDAGWTKKKVKKTILNINTNL